MTNMWNGYSVAGEIYMRLSLRVEKQGEGKYVIVDQTGWDGFSIQDPYIISTEYPSAEAAMDAINVICDLFPEMESQND